MLPKTQLKTYFTTFQIILAFATAFTIVHAEVQRENVRGRNEIVYDKAFDNGDSIHIEIRSRRGLVKGFVQYFDENGAAIKYVDYYVSGDNSVKQNDVEGKERTKRQSQQVPQLALVQGIPQANLQRF